MPPRVWRTYYTAPGSSGVFSYGPEFAMRSSAIAWARKFLGSPQAVVWRAEKVYVGTPTDPKSYEIVAKPPRKKRARAS